MAQTIRTRISEIDATEKGVVLQYHTLSVHSVDTSLQDLRLLKGCDFSTWGGDRSLSDLRRASSVIYCTSMAPGLSIKKSSKRCRDGKSKSSQTHRGVYLPCVATG